MGRWTEELRRMQALIPAVRDTQISSMASEPVVVTHCPSPVTTPQPIPPIRSGWLVAYRDQQGVLCGGCDDRQRGTVRECQWRMGIWTVRLTDGQQLPLANIRSVGQTNGEGKIIAAWTVREHGYDGMQGER